MQFSLKYLESTGTKANLVAKFLLSSDMHSEQAHHQKFKIIPVSLKFF